MKIFCRIVVSAKAHLLISLRDQTNLGTPKNTSKVSFMKDSEKGEQCVKPEKQKIQSHNVLLDRGAPGRSPCNKKSVSFHHSLCTKANTLRDTSSAGNRNVVCDYSTRGPSKTLDKVFYKAMYLHFDKRKPQQALPLYRLAIEKFKTDGSRHAIDMALWANLNYAKSIEDCFESQVEPNFLRSQINTFSRESDTRIELQAPQVKHMWKAIHLYTEGIDQLRKLKMLEHSGKIHLRLAECYEKIGMFNKSRETMNSCGLITLDAESKNQYDYGRSMLVGWNTQLFSIFESYYCYPFEKGISTLQFLIDKREDSEVEVLWYANLFLARKCSLHYRKYHRLASKSYERALAIKSSNFILGLEYGHFLQFIENNPRRSIQSYVRSISIMRKHLDLPGVKKFVLPQALFNLANAYISLSEPESAHPLLYEAKALYCRDKTNMNKVYKIRLVLAKALEDCGDTDQAFKTYSKILDFVKNGEKCKNTFQIDVMNQWNTLNVGEVYCRLAVFLKSTGKRDYAEQLFAKALVDQKTELATQIECLFSYSELLHEIGDNRKAKLMENHLFALVMKNHGSNVRLPLKVWLARVDALCADNRHECVENVFEFLTSKYRCSLAHTELSEVLRRLAEYFQQRRDYSAASNAYDNCIETDPSNVYLYVQKAWCLMHLGTPVKEVSDIFEKAIDLYENSKNQTQWDGCFCYGEYGVFLHENLCFPEAEKNYLKATLAANSTKSASYAHVCANLGVLYQMKRKSDDRDHWFRVALQVKPASYSPWLIYMDFLISTYSGKTLKLARRMLQLFPRYSGEIFIRLGKYFEMQHPSFPYRIAYAYYMAMKVSLPRSRKIQDDSLTYLYENTINVHALAEFAATLNYKMHFYKSAEVCYKVLSTRVPNDLNVALHYGKLALNHLNDHETARVQFEKALRIDPKYHLTYEYLAEYYIIANGDIDAAEDIYMQSIRATCGIEHVNACYHYALFLQKHDVTSHVINIYEELVRNFPKNSIALSSLALYLQSKLGEGHQKVAKIKFAMKNLKEIGEKRIEYSVKDYLPKKQLEYYTKECNIRIDKLAKALETISKESRFQRNSDVSSSLRRKISCSPKKNRESLANPLVIWNISDFLHDPTHLFVKKLVDEKDCIALDQKQQQNWEDLKKIHELYTQALMIDPDSIAILQHFANFLSTWMMDLLEGGKYFLKSVNVKPCSIDTMRSTGAFFLQTGNEHGLYPFIYIARGLYAEIIEDEACLLEDLLQYIAFAATEQEVNLRARIDELISLPSADEDTLSKILNKQATDLKILDISKRDTYQ